MWLILTDAITGKSRRLNMDAFYEIALGQKCTALKSVGMPGGGVFVTETVEQIEGTIGLKRPPRVLTEEQKEVMLQRARESAIFATEKPVVGQPRNVLGG